MEIEFIRKASAFLENPSLLVKFTAIIGKPVETGLMLLPAMTQNLVAKTTKIALDKALSVAIQTIGSSGAGSFEYGQEVSRKTNFIHTGATAALGFTGGAFGLLGSAVELPITTGVMLRRIASIARDHGQDMNILKTQLECLTVFAMVAPSQGDDGMKSAYFTSRIALNKLLDESAKWAAKKNSQEISAAVATKSAPILVQLISRIAARYNVMVTDALLAKSIPGVAMVNGSLINSAFTEYFNTVARYHFGIRALEDRYGQDLIRSLYENNKVPS